MDFEQPKVMGILNITPDSFYDGGKYTQVENAVKKALAMVAEGADIIDVGGYSSRPGATDISEKEECNRVIPVIEALVASQMDCLISIDTFRSTVARQAVAAGAGMINDISAGELDDRMFELVAELQVPYVMMHMKGRPQTMQDQPEYKDILSEVMSYFARKVQRLKSMGCYDILIDPGFGFGKSLDHNYLLMNHLQEFKLFELPVLVGVSRKSMINKVLGTSPEDAKNGGSVLHTIALLKGADIIRTHDVLEAKQAIKIVMQLQKN